MKLSTVKDTLHAFEVIDMAIAGYPDDKIKAFIDSSFGNGHSVVSCIQYLSGKRARSHIDSLPFDFLYKGFSRSDIAITVLACRDLDVISLPK